MNTFQQQYLSVLGAATGKKFLDAAETTANAIDTDKWITENTGNNWDPKTGKLSKSAGKWEKTGLSPDESSIIDDIAQRGLKTMPKGEVRDAFRYGMEEIQQVYRGRNEELQGLKARAESQQAVINKWAAKPHISRRQMKEFRKDIGGKK